MSVDSCLDFLRETNRSFELRQQLRATTDVKELVALGKRRGYVFDIEELGRASSSLAEGNESIETDQQGEPADNTATTSQFYHYEFDLAQLSGFGEVTAVLANLKIKPPTVDLEFFEKSFREDDFQWTSMSPAAPGFRGRYEEVMRSHWQSDLPTHEFSRRDFHLINLDQHVEHPLYDQYFQAKTRMIATLEEHFGSTVQFSGSMWYPPLGYRLWHTNETQPGWRMYLIDFDGPFEDSYAASFFRYMNPETKEIVTLRERPKLARFFKIEQEDDKLFWHCIVNATVHNRWSFGFAVPENWMDKLQVTEAHSS
jgi:Nif11 domain